MQVEVPDLGVLRGTTNRGVASFNGIPYAKPPVGPRRWQPPEVYGQWESPRDATEYGAACPQLNPSAGATSEDCLFLNVKTPVSALEGDASLPVMMWIHGGAYVEGSGHVYPGENFTVLAKEQVVLVTINYRLGALGFLASPEIQATTSDGSAGNFGIQDQRMAMAWVKDNIAAFGGDGESITIFGQSAGGNSIMNHLVRPASFPYFSKAIIQSGAADEGGLPWAKGLEYNQAFLTNSGCSDLACLRGLSTEDVMTYSNGQGSFSHGPVVDGVELPALAAELVLTGIHSKVPIMIGSTRDEAMTTQLLFDFSVASESAFDAAICGFNFFLLGKMDCSQLEKVKELYDPSVYSYPADLGGYDRWSWTLGRVITEVVPSFGHCGHRYFARALLAGGSEVVYLFNFQHSPQAAVPGLSGSGPGTVVASHSDELALLFGLSLATDEETELAEAMVGNWVEFSKSGNPNMPGQDIWPMYNAESDTVLLYRDASMGGITTVADMRRDVCDYFDQAHANRTAGEVQRLMTV